ncbi:MAG: hypothetical protein ABII22_03145 [Candidatus Micrarchaeota archaeon]
MCLVYSFNPQDYLYPGESRTNILKENFTQGNSLYSIVVMSGKPAFLLKDGELVQDDTTIKQVTKIYSASFFPSDEEIASLRNAIVAYNDSRNNGYGTNKGREENECRKVLLIDGGVKIGAGSVYCKDEESCDFASKILFSAYQQWIGWGGFGDAYDDLTAFALPSNNMDILMNDLIGKMNSITTENAYSTVKHVRDSIPTAKGYELQIESTKFRTPRQEDNADKQACYLKCYAMCPPLDLDAYYLSEAENESIALLSKIEVYNVKANLPEALAQETKARFAYIEGEEKAAIYIRQFGPMRDSANQILNESQYTLSLISDPGLGLKANRMSELLTNINMSFKNRNFTTMDMDLDELERVTISLNELVPIVRKLYDDTVALKDETNLAILNLQGKDLSDNSKQRLVQLKTLTDSTTQLFRPGLSSSVYQNMSLQYSLIFNQSNEILDEYNLQPVSFTTLKFRAFARRVNDGFASLSSSTNSINNSEVKNQSLPVIGGFSALSFLSIVALLLFVFLVLFSGMKNSGSLAKIGLAFVFFALVIVVLVFSVFLYLNMENAAFSANIDEFRYYVQKSNHIVVLMNTSGISQDVRSSMAECSVAIARNLEQANRSVDVFSLEGDSCSVVYSTNSTVQSATPSFCEQKINENPSFILSYSSSTKDPMFLTSYENKAYLYGDSAYYGACIIKSAFN